MLVYLRPTNPLLGLHNQTPSNKVLSSCTYIDIGNCKVNLILYSLLKYSVRPSPLKGILSKQKLIKHYSYRPDIRLKVVLLISHNFRSHRKLTSKFSHRHLILQQLLTKPQVRYFALMIMQKYVLNFEISMHSIDLMKSLKTIQNLFEILYCFGLMNIFLLNQ